MPPSDRFFWVDIGYACFGIGSQNGTVCYAAPIAAWMVGKTLAEVRPWLLAKKATVIECCQ